MPKGSGGGKATAAAAAAKAASSSGAAGSPGPTSPMNNVDMWSGGLGVDSAVGSIGGNNEAGSAGGTGKGVAAPRWKTIWLNFEQPLFEQQSCVINDGDVIGLALQTSFQTGVFDCWLGFAWKWGFAFVVVVVVVVVGCMNGKGVFDCR